MLHLSSFPFTGQFGNSLFIFTTAHLAVTLFNNLVNDVGYASIQVIILEPESGYPPVLETPDGCHIVSMLDYDYERKSITISQRQLLDVPCYMTKPNSGVFFHVAEVLKNNQPIDYADWFDEKLDHSSDVLKIVNTTFNSYAIWNGQIETPYTWTNLTGLVKNGEFGVFPPCEVALAAGEDNNPRQTDTLQIDGTIVLGNRSFSNVINEWHAEAVNQETIFATMETLRTNPVILTLTRGVITELAGNEEVIALFQRLFEINPIYRNCIELGFGLQPLLAYPGVNSGLTEGKGLHIGFGLPPNTGVHMDLYLHHETFVFAEEQQLFPQK